MTNAVAFRNDLPKNSHLQQPCPHPSWLGYHLESFERTRFTVTIHDLLTECYDLPSTVRWQKEVGHTVCFTLLLSPRLCWYNSSIRNSGQSMRGAGSHLTERMNDFHCNVMTSPVPCPKPGFTDLRPRSTQPMRMSFHQTVLIRCDEIIFKWNLSI